MASVLPVRLSFSCQAPWVVVLFVVRPIPHTLLFYNIWPIDARGLDEFLQKLLLMLPTRLQGLWQWAHIFLLLSILCSGFYAAILPVLLLLLPEPIHVYCHESVFYLLLLALQLIFLLDTIQHTSFCIHNCTSLKFPQFRLSRIGGTYHSFGTVAVWSG